MSACPVSVMNPYVRVIRPTKMAACWVIRSEAKVKPMMMPRYFERSPINIFNATKISFWNEMWRVCQTIGVDHDEVATTVARSAEASYNPDYGIRGGAPYGGVCLPKDTNGFLGFAAQHEIDMPLLSAVVEVNEQMADLVERELATLQAESDSSVAR